MLKSRIGKRLTRATLPAIATTGMAVAMMGISAPSASALDQYFNCGVIAVDSWCQYTNNHSWRTVRAEWNGTAVPMCSKIINSAGDHNGTRNCATAAVVYSILQTAHIGPNTWALVANGSSGTSKTIYGYAWT